MTTTENNLVKFDPPKAIEAVKLKVSVYEGLKIAGLDDKEGYEKVRVAIGECVSTRTEFVATCKTAREEANTYAKYVIEQEKIGVSEVEKIELALKDEKKKIDDEKERIKAEKEQKEQAKLQVRVDELAKYGYTHDLFDLRHLPEHLYEELKTTKRIEFEHAEKARIAKEEADRIEREAFEKAQAEQKAKEIELEQREIDLKEAERKIREAEGLKHAEEAIERAKKDAAEKSRIETEARIKREQADKEQKEREEQAELEKKKKYKTWLEENKATNDDKIEKTADGKKVILWRKVSEFII